MWQIKVLFTLDDTVMFSYRDISQSTDKMTLRYSEYLHYIIVTSTIYFDQKNVSIGHCAVLILQYYM